ncbi:MAG: phosphoribosylanthranilate isomerase [Lachnospiraceae bacterium]|nr:phosphoribosylanthranilate isomerase [Lachnospiraceae bacterium]
MMAKIKICGLTRLEDIAAVNCWKPDYIGFVFAKSRRQVTREQAAELKKWLRQDIQAVGVFVNSRPEEAAALFQDGIIDLIQLHGQETKGTIRRLKELTDGKAPVIKAVRMETEQSIEPWLDSCADYLLLDNGPGGTGQTFDHSLIQPQRIGKPFFLAGGINLENAETAVRSCMPFCLDVSSGVETDGRKDAKKIEELVRLVRRIKN